MGTRQEPEHLRGIVGPDEVETNHYNLLRGPIPKPWAMGRGTAVILAGDLLALTAAACARPPEPPGEVSPAAKPIVEFKIAKTEQDQSLIGRVIGVEWEPAVGLDDQGKRQQLTSLHCASAEINKVPDKDTFTAFCKLTDDGRKLFKQITRLFAGKTLGVFIDGKFRSRHKLKEEDGDAVAVSIINNASEKEAEQLVNKLNAEALVRSLSPQATQVPETVVQTAVPQKSPTGEPTVGPRVTPGPDHTPTPTSTRVRETPIPTVVVRPSQERPPEAGWARHASDKLQYTMHYPSGWGVGAGLIDNTGTLKDSVTDIFLNKRSPNNLPAFHTGQVKVRSIPLEQNMTLAQFVEKRKAQVRQWKGSAVLDSISSPDGPWPKAVGSNMAAINYQYEGYNVSGSDAAHRVLATSNRRVGVMDVFIVDSSRKRIFHFQGTLSFVNSLNDPEEAALRQDDAALTKMIDSVKLGAPQNK